MCGREQRRLRPGAGPYPVRLHLQEGGGSTAPPAARETLAGPLKRLLRGSRGRYLADPLPSSGSCSRQACPLLVAFVLSHVGKRVVDLEEWKQAFAGGSYLIEVG